MNIAIIVPIIGNFGRKGFYHSQEIGLAKEITKKNHNVTVYKCVPLKSLDNIIVEEFDGLTVKYIPTYSVGPHGIFRNSLLEKGTDIAFVFSDTQLIIPNLYRYCKTKKIKFIPYVGIAHSFQKNIKSKVIDFIFRHTTLKVYKKEKVLAKTEEAKSELIKMGVKNCSVAPVGLDFDSLKTDFESFDRVNLRKKWGFSSTDIIISFVGRLQPEKRPLELVDVFKKVKFENKKLVIIGKGSLIKELKEKIKQEGLLDKIIVIPQVKYEEMWEIHYIADYFLNLRTDEIFGMAIMEAIYYKSSVIAISSPGPNTILRDMKGHFICESLDDIPDIINQMEINKNNLNKDQVLLKEKFSWGKCVSEIFKE